MSKHLSRTLALLLVFGLTLAACREVQEEEELPPPQATEAAVEEVKSQFALVGTAWELESFFGPEDSLPVLPGTRLSVNYSVEKYAGTGGCNWFLGVYGVENDTLRMNTPTRTRAVCEPIGIMNQEATYNSSLLNVTRYEMDGEKLLAYTVEDQLLLTFVPAQEIALEGTEWRMQLYNNGKRMVEFLPGTEITATFEDGQVSGSSGCNSYNASVELDGDQISIGPIALTQMMCEEPAGIMEQEAVYLQMLETAAAYEKLGGVLHMHDGEGVPILFFGAP